MIERRHRCQHGRRPWVTYGIRYPDARCPFCHSPAISSTVVSR